MLSALASTCFQGRLQCHENSRHVALRGGSDGFDRQVSRHPAERLISIFTQKVEMIARQRSLPDTRKLDEALNQSLEKRVASRWWYQVRDAAERTDSKRQSERRIRCRHRVSRTPARTNHDDRAQVIAMVSQSLCQSDDSSSLGAYAEFSRAIFIRNHTHLSVDTGLAESMVLHFRQNSEALDRMGPGAG